MKSFELIVSLAVVPTYVVTKVDVVLPASTLDRADGPVVNPLKRRPYDVGAGYDVVVAVLRLETVKTISPELLVENAQIGVRFI